MALPKRVYRLNNTGPVCVGCQEPVSPGFCRTGSIVVGIQFMDRSSVKLVSMNPVAYAEEHKRVAFFDRRKGRLCERCSANYHHVTYRKQDGSVISEPIVVTDPTPGFIGITVAGESATKRAPLKGLNTRYTR
jgi:hypothetical protein